MTTPKVALITGVIGQDALLARFKLPERYETKFRETARKVRSAYESAEKMIRLRKAWAKAIGRSHTTMSSQVQVSPSLRA